MHFFIITPTYNRLSQLQRNIKSVQDQDFDGFTHYIIDDSEVNDTEKWFSGIDLKNIVYIRNHKNLWSNLSKNRALDTLFSCPIPDDSYVIFLDDDDYMPPDALVKLDQAISLNIACSWYISRRVYSNGQSITKVKKWDWTYSYVHDYLLWNIISWDATHIIKSALLENIRFAPDIKNGEEWIFFLQVARKSDIFFLNLPSTWTDGYSVDWLTLRLPDRWFRRKMLTRMYGMVGELFPDVNRWKILLWYIYYLPWIWHICSSSRKLIWFFK